MFYFVATNITADPGESIGKGRHVCSQESLYLVSVTGNIRIYHVYLSQMGNSILKDILLIGTKDLLTFCSFSHPSDWNFLCHMTLCRRVI